MCADQINEDYGLITPILVRPRMVGSPGGCPEDSEIAIVKQLAFDPRFQNMSVITKQKLIEGYSLYMKGAPKKIARLCDPNTGNSKYFFMNIRHKLKNSATNIFFS